MMAEYETDQRTWWREHTDAIESSSDVRAEVFVRSLGAPSATQGTQTSVLETLDELEEKGRIDRFITHVWGDRLYPEERCSETAAGQFFHDKIADFERWAEELPVSLPFETRVSRPFVTGEELRSIALPRICLAVYVDGRLDGVVPSQFDGVNICVREYLSALSSLRSDPFEDRNGTGPKSVAESI